MAREARILKALHPTAIPVPEVIAECGDAAVIGAPFYVMEYVAGHIIRDRLPRDYPRTSGRDATGGVNRRLRGITPPLPR